MRDRSYYTAVRYLVLAPILWGIGTAFRQPVLRHHEAGPLAISFVIALAGTLVMLFLVRKRQAEVLHWYRKHPVFYFTLGILQFGGTVFTYVAMQELSLTTVSMLLQTQPLFSQLFAFVLLRERVAKCLLPYALVAVLGSNAGRACRKSSVIPSE